MESSIESYRSLLDDKRHETENGVDYWMGRDIGAILDYTEWRNFRTVIEKSIAACESSGVPSRYHFVATDDMVEIGSGAQRHREDWFLTRHACYLLAMNADSSKPQVGFAMTYFAVQTRRQELSDQQKRLELRLRIMENNHKLAGAAKQAGVQRYPVFQDAGYRGLYSMGLADLKVHKGLTQGQDLLDHAGRLELAANDFRITLTEHRLNRDRVRTETEAIYTHRNVGAEVRASIVKDNGVSPEDLPTESSLKPLVQKHKRAIQTSSRQLPPVA